MFEHILVPFDGSPLAEVVLPHLVLLSRINRPRISLVRVLDADSTQNGQGPVDPFGWQLRKVEAEQYLNGNAQRLDALGIQAEAVVLEGRAAETILDYALLEHADLILMSSHGRSGLSGWNVSSVVQKIIMRARTSVMIVRAYTGQPAQLDELKYSQILLPLDGSARAEIVIPVATAIAKDQNAQIIMAHVIQKPALPRRTPLSMDEIEISDRLVECNRQEASLYQEELSARLGIDIETRLLIDDNPIAALHRLAEQEEIQLVIMSAHGYSGETRWPFGSMVTSFIVYGITPLLVIQDLPAERIEPTMAEIIAREQGAR